jgi:3',5'-cyclic AMP phosphodiesterase CpdA
MNVILVRRRMHRMELLAALGRELRARPPDHLALTGDLANVSLEAEWRRALHWLEENAGAPDDVTVIPGNHDTYVPGVVAAGTFEKLFAPYQSAELRHAHAGYPFVRLRGDVALVAVNTSVPTGDLHAWGEIGAAQLGRLEALLNEPEVKRRVRVVLLHHPPVVHRPPDSRNLRDRDALVALLGRTGAELVLHGHDHRDEQATLAGPGGASIPVVGVGSASYDAGPDRRSRYNVYEIDGRRITAVTFAESGGSYSEVRRLTLAG